MHSDEPVLRPSEVSRRILVQHRAVEARLEELSRIAKTLAQGGPSAFADALRLTRALHNQLLSHIRFEGESLVRAFFDADAWGAIRASELLLRLRLRRQQLQALRNSFTNPQVSTLGAGLDEFIAGRRADMTVCERRSVRILRDDVHGIDVEGG